MNKYKKQLLQIAIALNSPLEAMVSGVFNLLIERQAENVLSLPFNFCFS